jgi:CHAT domain-containing protein/tetratricopeptide (TPR) repeat protein
MSSLLKVAKACRFALAGVVLLGLMLSIRPAGSHAAAQSQESFPLQLGQSIHRELAPELKHVYKIAVGANQFIHIKVEQLGLDVALVLVAPTGEQIFQLDSPNGRNGPEEIRAALADAGEYILEVRAVEKLAPAGGYTATIIEVRAATDDDFKSFRATRLFVEARILRNQRTGSALRQALTKLAEAERLRVELGDKLGQIEVIKYIGITNQVLGDQQTAIATYQRGIPLTKEVGAVEEEAIIYNNLGFIYYKIDDFQNALFYMRLGLETKLGAGKEESTGELLENIGTTYLTVGEPEKAIEYFTRAQAIARKYKLSKIEAHALRDLGLAYSSLGDHQRALAMALEALPAMRQLRDGPGELTTLLHIASEYLALGDDQNALKYFEQGLKASIEGKNSLNVASAYYGIGRVYDRQGDPLKAIANFKEALGIVSLLETPRRTARVLSAMAASEFKAGRYSEAETDMRKAIDLIESVRNRLSAQELRTSFFSSENREIYEASISLLMDLHKQAEDKGYDKEAFAASEKARARSLLELLAVARTDIRQGVDAGLLERERGLRDRVNDKAAQLSRLLVARAADDKVAAAKSDYARTEEELQQVEAQIRKASPRYAALMQSQTVSLAETRALLDKDSALLEYSLGKDRSFLWVITSDSMQTFALPKRADIEKSARAVYELLTARNRTIKFETVAEKRARIARAETEISQAASFLSRMVLAPAAKALAKKRLLIVPDGALYYVPFAILPIANPQIRNDRLLILDHEVVNLPSASALAMLRQELKGRVPASRTVAIFADPVFGREDERYKSVARKANGTRPGSGLVAKSRGVEATEFSDLTRAAREGDGEDSGASLPRLPFTRQEAEAIAAIASTKQSQRLLDFSASRTRALGPELSQYRIIHFATHSFISSAHPQVSGVVLSLIDENGDDQDGFIRAADVYNLKLPADLIVLSGCRTGLGREIRGEGMVGMTQSFMYAGAARVMVSLWDVQDEATADLMKRFYRGLLAEKLSPAAALRAAQVSMAGDKRWSSPYYWAGFTLQGEPR